MQETWIRSLAQEDPTRKERSPRAATIELLLRAQLAQLLKPKHPKACAPQQEKPPQGEACTPQSD